MNAHMPELPQLGCLQPVDPRWRWPEEALVFAPWLAEPDSLRLIDQACEVDLEPNRTESEVGNETWGDRLLLMELIRMAIFAPRHAISPGGHIRNPPGRSTPSRGAGSAQPLAVGSQATDVLSNLS